MGLAYLVLQADFTDWLPLQFIQDNHPLGLITFFKFQLGEWASGRSGLSIKDHATKSPLPDDGFFEYAYGGFHFGKVREEEIPIIELVTADWQARMKDWEELANLIRIREELKRLDSKLNDDLMIIILRRVLPGRCRYCPI
jgi:hypothetical protein